MKDPKATDLVLLLESGKVVQCSQQWIQTEILKGTFS